MTEVIGIRFKHGSKTYYFDPNGVKAVSGDLLVVETAQGAELVHCAMGNHQVLENQVVKPLRPVLRQATEADQQAAQNAQKREEEAFVVCQKKIADHMLDMKLVRVESNFEGNKIVFFFTADGRVDFRELVKDLAFVFRARIELRQIGVRDEAKMLGGLGICGQPFCCSRFLEDFIPVSIKMAKTQNLSLNPTKISGTCGRLMCCLKYEQEAYEDAVKRMPKNESFVQTPDGLGNVIGLDLLREKISVRLDNHNEGTRRYDIEEVRVLRSGKGSREGVPIPLDLPRRKPRQEVPQPEPKRELFPLLEEYRDNEAGSGSAYGTEKRRRNRGGRNRGSSNKGEPGHGKKTADAPLQSKGSDEENRARPEHRCSHNRNANIKGAKEVPAGAPAEQRNRQSTEPKEGQVSSSPNKRRRNRGGRGRRGNGGQSASGSAAE